MHTVGQRLKDWRKAKGLTQQQLAQLLGLPWRTYQNYENDVRPPSTKGWESFARVGIDPNWLLTGVGEMSLQALPLEVISEGPLEPTLKDLAAEAVTAQDEYQVWADNVDGGAFAPIRYYRNARVSAGHGAQNYDATPDALLFSKAFLKTIGAKPASLFLVRVKGDSMYPTLQSGWTVMIDSSRTEVTSGIYVVRVGCEEVCKRLEARPGGVVKVISDNRMYEEYEIGPGRDDFEVIGKVIWFAGLVQ